MTFFIVKWIIYRYWKFFFEFPDADGEKKGNKIVGYQKRQERDLTQSYDENPYTNRKFNNKLTTQKRHQKLRLHSDCWHTEDGRKENFSYEKDTKMEEMELKKE